MTQSVAGARVVVLGAGLVGAATARAFAERGAHVRVIAPRGPAASDVPRALAQPVMGKRAGFSHRRFAAWRQARALLERWDPERTAWRTIDVFRTPPSERARDEWRTKLMGKDPALCPAEAHEGPAGWAPAYGPWRLRDGLLVSPRALRALLLDGLERSYATAPIPTHASALGADLVVACTGARGIEAWARFAGATRPAPLWGDAALLALPGHGLQAVIGVGAQIVPIGGDHLLVQGTHRQPPTLTGVDHNALTRMVRAQAEHWPPVEGARWIGAWAGARARTDRAHPLVGAIGDAVYLASAFGPRGVLFGLPAAGTLVAHVCEGAPLPPEWAPSLPSVCAT